MAYISSDGSNYIAISTGCLLNLIEKCSGSILFSYENQLTSTEKNNSDDKSPNFVCHVFSKDGEYFAALTEDKKLLVWRVKEKALHCHYNLSKRPTSLDFCHHEDTIVTADKYGDVYKCGFNTKQNTGPTLLLGHLSMVLSVCMSLCDKYIITADRDEKIRVSCYPNSYSIHSYCLGHQQLVSSLCVLDDTCLLSSSADSTLRLWNYRDGVELSCIDSNFPAKEKSFVINQICCRGNMIAVIGEECNDIFLYEFTGNGISFISSNDLEGWPYSMAFISENEVLVLVKNSKHPLKVLEKRDQENAVVKNATFLNEILIETDCLPNPSFYTNLVKPQRAKRSNAAITPEATINFESAAKIMKTINSESIST